MEEPIHIQSEKAREKITDVFCKLIAVSSFSSVFIYLYLRIYELSVATGLIGLLFLFFIRLNKKGQNKASRTAIILTTNLGVIFFSFYLGYDSGIYLYLFVAPLLIYLLFDFNERTPIICFLLMYLATFVLIYFFPTTFFIATDKLSPAEIKFIYSFNFCSAFILCFGLVFYFANNNDKYILNLKRHKELLTEEVNLRTESEDKLKKSLKEREILLAEVHHRVKSNLAIISALINMQLESIEDASSKQIFEETKNRVYAMSLIHNLLYRNNSFEKIDFVQYIELFCKYITKSYEDKKHITIEYQIDDVVVDLGRAIPLALIMNELVTNAFKHAFRDLKEGKIIIGIEKFENNHLNFWVADTGVGMDKDILDSNTIGINIVTALIDQINGELKYEKNNGSRFVVSMPVIAD